jgi:hypothetical protein
LCQVHLADLVSSTLRAVTITLLAPGPRSRTSTRLIDAQVLTATCIVRRWSCLRRETPVHSATYSIYGEAGASRRPSILGRRKGTTTPTTKARDKRAAVVVRGAFPASVNQGDGTQNLS